MYLIALPVSVFVLLASGYLYFRRLTFTGVGIILSGYRLITICAALLLVLALVTYGRLVSVPKCGKFEPFYYVVDNGAEYSSWFQKTFYHYKPKSLWNYCPDDRLRADNLEKNNQARMKQYAEHACTKTGNIFHNFRVSSRDEKKKRILLPAAFADIQTIYVYPITQRRYYPHKPIDYKYVDWDDAISQWKRLVPHQYRQNVFQKLTPAVEKELYEAFQTKDLVGLAVEKLGNMLAGCGGQTTPQIIPVDNFQHPDVDMPQSVTIGIYGSLQAIYHRPVSMGISLALYSPDWERTIMSFLPDSAQPDWSRQPNGKWVHFQTRAVKEYPYSSTAFPKEGEAASIAEELLREALRQDIEASVSRNYVEPGKPWYLRPFFKRAPLSLQEMPANQMNALTVFILFPFAILVVLWFLYRRAAEQKKKITTVIYKICLLCWMVPSVMGLGIYATMMIFPKCNSFNAFAINAYPYSNYKLSLFERLFYHAQYRSLWPSCSGNGRQQAAWEKMNAKRKALISGEHCPVEAGLILDSMGEKKDVLDAAYAGIETVYVYVEPFRRSAEFSLINWMRRNKGEEFRDNLAQRKRQAKAVPPEYEKDAQFEQDVYQFAKTSNLTRLITSTIRESIGQCAPGGRAVKIVEVQEFKHRHIEKRHSLTMAVSFAFSPYHSHYGKPNISIETELYSPDWTKALHKMLPKDSELEYDAIWINPQRGQQPAFNKGALTSAVRGRPDLIRTFVFWEYDRQPKSEGFEFSPAVEMSDVQGLVREMLKKVLETDIVIQRPEAQGKQFSRLRAQTTMTAPSY